MMTYLIVLALGLYFVYAVRDMLLVLQNRHDEKLAKQQAEQAYSTISIQQNSEQCKRFERAS